VKDTMQELRSQLDMTYRLLRTTEDAVLAERRRDRELNAADAEDRASAAVTRRIGG